MFRTILILAGVALIAMCCFGQRYFPPAGLTEWVPSEWTHPEPPMQTDDWPILQSYPLSIANPVGLTWDGEYFFITNYQSSASSCIYKVDSQGNNVTTIPSPDMWPCGITFDGEYLWVHDFVVGHSQYPTIMSMCKVDPLNGNVLQMLESAYTYYAAGVAWDGECLWYGKKSASSPPCPCFIYKLNPLTGLHEDTIQVTTGDIYGLTYLDDHLFYSNAYTDILYKIDLEGNIVDQSPAPGPNPNGLTIAMDELWNNENDNTTLFCLDIDVNSLSITLTPHNPPITIPAGGGSFTFDLLIENPTPNPITFDGWTLVMMPGGLPYPIITRPDITLASGGSISRTLTQNVPAAAIPGEYEYVGNIGEYPSTIWDTDSFPFTKLLDDGCISGDPGMGWELYGWDEMGGVSSAIPEKYVVLTAYPNPFNPRTTLRFELVESKNINLSIFDVTGREIANLADGIYPSGIYDFKFNSDNLTSGIYFAKLNIGSTESSLKLLLLK